MTSQIRLELEAAKNEYIASTKTSLSAADAFHKYASTTLSMLPKLLQEHEDEIAQLKAELKVERERLQVLRGAIVWIAEVSAMDYEYQRCARAALTQTDEIAQIKAGFAPTPPWEFKTEAEKTAFAFSWWKALEAQPLIKHKDNPND
jgi:hypothetical protein